ncbi:MAG TPA: alpha/beta hydrolase [Rhizomicrobium sp.]|nr:alpha/beta hydrolase [Rhizomicrobium sp.]
MLNLLVPRSGYSLRADLAYGGNPRQKLDLYIPDGLNAPAPVMLFFYGGTWQSGTKDLYRALGQAFATKGIIVAVADYRLYPEVKYPEFLNDGAMALRFVHEHVAQYGGDPNRVFLGGHSAGAYIAVMLASDPEYLSDVHGDFSWIRGVIGIAGPYDFLPLHRRDLIAIFGGPNRTETQPISYIDGKRPTMLLVAGADDVTVEPANTTRMEARLKGFGSEVETKIYPGVAHIGIILSLAPGFRGRTTLREDILRFIAAH